MTLAELMQLPYGDTDAALGQLSLEELMALPYQGPGPFARGQIGEERRQEMRDHGERVAWLRCLDTGRAYFDRVHLKDDVRVFIYENKGQVQGQEYGDIAVGQTMLSFMSDEIQPVRNDRFIALNRTFAARSELLPSNNATPSLDWPVHSITEVRGADNETLRPSTYAVRNGKFFWFREPPAFKVTVFYQANKVYEWLGENTKQGQMGADGVRLPDSGPLRLLREGEI